MPTKHTNNTNKTRIFFSEISRLFAYLVGKISYSWRGENLRKPRWISPIALRILQIGERSPRRPGLSLSADRLCTFLAIQSSGLFTPMPGRLSTCV